MKRSRPVRLMLVDDHPVVRQGLVSMLSATPEIEVVEQAANAAECIRKAKELRPDVILLDIRLPGVDGWDACQVVTALIPETAVIMLTSFQDEDHLFRALRAGARGYLVKTATQEEIVESILAVAAGSRLLSPAMVDRLVERYAELAREIEQQGSGLDGHEIDILRLLAEGATNKEIGERLHWSEVSVKRKLQAVFEKLGVQDRTAAAVEASRRGLI